jgi:solute:Na+ symporter, SSS family
VETYFYQYSVGTFIFILGLFYSFKQNYIGFHGRGLKNLLIFVLGIVGYMLLQGYMQFGDMDYSPAVKYTGGELKRGIKGQPLDYIIMVVYFLVILAIGTWFGRRQKTTKDFFFGGQRFSWWLIAFSLIATTIGSYSFVKYSKIAYQYGLSSSQTYLNDWFWFPLLIGIWMPIIYFSRVVSIPEYFERRFNRSVRLWATVLILIYLIGYVGVNLFTMGKALNMLLGWEILYSAILVASISAVYVTAGGQTSVIMTDLFQGVMLLATGILILYLGAEHLGGITALWENLPRGHRTAFPNFNTSSSFSGLGVFWQDGMANTAVFYFLNQGIMMRFLAAKSVNEGRKAAIIVPLVLMPVAACVVASGGWVGKALENAGHLPANMDPASVFFIASEFLCKVPGLFGLIMASLTAALMSTVDTLITAVAAIIVNDLYKPYVNKNASEKQLLKVARITSVSVTLIGIMLVPVFMIFDSIYAAHGAFTAAITPPLVVALLFSVLWRRFTAKAAIYTLAGGIFAIILSIFFPEIITPFAQGIPMAEAQDGIFSGVKQYKYIRAFYGLSVSFVIAIVSTFFTTPETAEKMKGLVWNTINDALKNYKGKEGDQFKSVKSNAFLLSLNNDTSNENEVALKAVLSQDLAKKLDAEAGDLIYVSDRRWWLGGLNSGHCVVETIDSSLESNHISIDKSLYELIMGNSKDKKSILVEKMY